MIEIVNAQSIEDLNTKVKSFHQGKIVLSVNVSVHPMHDRYSYGNGDICNQRQEYIAVITYEYTS